MKRKKKIKILFIILFFLILVGAAAVAVGNLSFFDIKEVKLSTTGPVYGMPLPVQRYLTGLTGRNMYSLNSAALKKNIENCEGVSSVRIEKYYPSQLCVFIDFEPYDVRYITESSRYCSANGKLVEVSEELFNLCTGLPVVEIADSYARFIVKWGMEEGFAQMAALVSGIPSKSLISDIKYVNNNSNRFGRVVMTIPSLNAELFIEDPITYERLEEVLEQIDGGGWYDVHAYKLVKHRET